MTFRPTSDQPPTEFPTADLVGARRMCVGAFFAFFAFFAPMAYADTAASVAVSNVTATQMPTSTSATRRSLMVENRGTNAIYCSPSSSVTTDTGFKVAAGAWRSFPGVVVWCIAETAAQAGTGTDRTLVWESDS